MDKLVKKLIIYLADLDHCRSGNRISVPLGIGSIASYCKNIYDQAVDIFLFKDPNELMEAIRRQPPHVLGCSFYMWNTKLTLKIIEACKIISPRTLTVIGGPDVARNTDNFKILLNNHWSLDIVVLDQGEKSFSNVLNTILEENFITKDIFSKSIDGCALRLNGIGPVERGRVVLGGIDINKFPSPYLAGYLDKFLAADFLPTFETVRGCPHQCTFCGGGAGSFMPMSVKNETTVREELLYILKRCKSKELDLIDTNFGIMEERDLRISSFMLELYNKHEFPRIMGYATSKHKTKTSVALMINLAKMTGDLHFALQSLTELVLSNCKRQNVPRGVVEELIEISKKNCWQANVDLIFGLPGETLESFLKVVDEIVSWGVNAPGIYQLRMLRGTTIAEQDREKYGYKTKFRLINGRYGEYALIPGQALIRIVEVEEVVYQNNDFSFDDFLTVRIFGFMLRLLISYGALLDTVSYLLTKKIKISEIFKMVRQTYQRKPNLKKLFNDYRDYSIRELFDSEDELMERIITNDNAWNDLLLDRVDFFKLDFGFAGYCLFENILIMEDIEQLIKEGVRGQLSDEEVGELNEVLRHDKLYRAVQEKGPDKLEEKDLEQEIVDVESFDYDRWKKSGFSGGMRKFRLELPIRAVYCLENLDFIKKMMEECRNLSGYLFYEKILVGGPKTVWRIRR